MRTSSRPHSSFVEFLDCVAVLTGQEELELLRRSPAAHDLWMMSGLPQFSEFRTNAGIEALRKVWERLPELKEEGKGAIQVSLRGELLDKFPEDHSAIIANAIWSCILLHGDRSECGQGVDKPEGSEPELGAEEEPAGQIPADRSTADRRTLVEAFLRKCAQEIPLKVTRTHIWRAVGHTKPRQFQYWQSGQDRLPGTTRGATEEDDRNFRRVLAMAPADFAELLKKKGIE